MKYLAAFLVLVVATPVLALDIGPSLYIAVAPQYPAPAQPVTLTIQNPLVDLSEREITWRNNGVVVLTGEGETIYRTTAPNAGERIDMTVSVAGLEEMASISIAPSSVDLLWESNSFAPGLYRGRHLPSRGSVLTLHALPHLTQKGVELPASQLVFTWKQEGQVVMSGKGKSSFSIPVAEFVDTSTISVSVTTSDKTIGAERSVVINAAEPVVRLYFDHPLFGVMYHNALTARSIVSETEVSFAAIPYFAQATGANDKLFSYIWRVNRTTIEPNSEQPNTITINAGPAGGPAQIEVSLTHTKNFQLDARGTWNVTFGSIAGGSSGVVGDPFTGQ